MKLWKLMVLLCIAQDHAPHTFYNICTPNSYYTVLYCICSIRFAHCWTVVIMSNEHVTVPDLYSTPFGRLYHWQLYICTTSLYSIGYCLVWNNAESSILCKNRKEILIYECYLLFTYRNTIATLHFTTRWKDHLTFTQTYVVQTNYL